MLNTATLSEFKNVCKRDLPGETVTDLVSILSAVVKNFSASSVNRSPTLATRRYLKPVKKPKLAMLNHTKHISFSELYNIPNLSVIIAYPQTTGLVPAFIYPK